MYRGAGFPCPPYSPRRTGLCSALQDRAVRSKTTKVVFQQPLRPFRPRRAIGHVEACPIALSFLAMSHQPLPIGLQGRRLALPFGNQCSGLPRVTGEYPTLGNPYRATLASNSTYVTPTQPNPSGRCGLGVFLQPLKSVRTEEKWFIVVFKHGFKIVSRLEGLII